MRQYIPYILPLLGLGGLGGVLILWLRSRVQLGAQEGGLDLQARANKMALEQLPVKLLGAELAKREAELAGIRAEDAKERRELVTVLVKIETTMTELVTAMQGHREEEARRTAAIHIKLEAIHLDIRGHA